MSTKDLKKNALDLFENTFFHSPSMQAITPGRVNLIGEHTDYNDGFVFPCAINLYVYVTSSRRDDDEIHVISGIRPNDEIVFTLNTPIEKAEGKKSWSNYVRGIADILLQKGFSLKGANLAITGDLPLGAGLSSSAALEVSIANTLLALSGISLEKVEVAKLCQRAENEYLNCKCGIMDQMAVSLSQKDHALLLDCQSLESKLATIPEDLSIIIINSNVEHSLAGGEYNKRTEQCRKACEILGVTSLRNSTLDQLENNKNKMTNVVYRRARHVLDENKRTEDFFNALKLNDIKSINTLMSESHNSLKHDYEVTVPETEALVDIVNTVIDGKGGARMTGGGFGGSIVVLTTPENIDPIRQAVETKYPQLFNKRADIHVCKASDGAEIFSYIA